MTSPHPSEDKGLRQPRAIRTNGEGKRTTAHLNLTRTFAEVIRDGRDFLRIVPSPKRSKK